MSLHSNFFGSMFTLPHDQNYLGFYYALKFMFIDVPVQLIGDTHEAKVISLTKGYTNFSSLSVISSIPASPINVFIIKIANSVIEVSDQ